MQIAGRSYKIACAEGEESHIADLAQTIDGKLATLPGLAGQSEQRTLLYACLLLADEVHEARNAPPQVPVETHAPPPDVAEPLEMLADRLESLASRLEDSDATH